MKEVFMPQEDRKERAILSTMLARQDVFPQMCQFLTVEDFYNPVYKTIFTCLLGFYRRGYKVDMNDLTLACHSAKIEDAANLVASIKKEYSIAFVHQDYAQALKNASNLRAIISHSQGLITASTQLEADSADVANLMSECAYKVKSNGISNGMRSVTEILDDFSDQGSFEQHLEWMLMRKSNLLPAYDGVTSGYDILDKTFGFFRKAALYYIGARTSMGKTTFMLNLIANQMAKRIPIGVFSLEMPSEQIVPKIMCIFSEVNYRMYEDVELYEEKIARLCETRKMFKDQPLYISAPSSITINQLCVEAQRMVDHHGVKIIYIDYLTRIRSSGKFTSKHLEIDAISKALQSLARQLDVPIICLAQLNRASSNGTAEHRPKLSDFRESGSIEEDCDGAILLHRPEYYDRTDAALKGKVEVIVAKNRIRGKVCKIDYFCDSARSERYEEVDVERKIQEANERNKAPFNEYDR